MMRVIYLVMLGVLGALLLRGFGFERIVVVTGSMEPTLPVGKVLYVNKFIYHFKSPARGDIVMLPSPKEKKDLIKRVIAVGGDDLRIEMKNVILNGTPLDEPYVMHSRPNEVLDGDNMKMGRVPADHVVVMGDNRDWSGDSRDWKIEGTDIPVPFVPVVNIRGKVMVDP